MLPITKTSKIVLFVDRDLFCKVKDPVLPIMHYALENNRRLAPARTKTTTEAREVQGSYTFFDQKFKDFSRPFKDTFFHFLRTQERQNQAHVMPHQMLKVESVPIFISDT